MVLQLYSNGTTKISSRVLQLYSKNVFDGTPMDFPWYSNGTLIVLLWYSVSTLLVH